MRRTISHGREGHEANREADDGDDVLRLAEDLADQDRPPLRSDGGAVEPVLEIGGLEILEALELGGVLHQPNAGRVCCELARREGRFDLRFYQPAAEDVAKDGAENRTRCASELAEVAEMAALPYQPDSEFGRSSKAA